MGFSVSIDKDSVAVGAPFDGSNGSNAGASYIFTRNGSSWSLQAKLFPSDSAAGDYFGYAVSVMFDTLAVGAPWKNSQTVSYLGAAYVFSRAGTTWAQSSGQLIPPDGNYLDKFGISVALDTSQNVVVGAPAHDGVDGQSDTGAAYIFSPSGNSAWAFANKINGFLNGGQFGQSVAVHMTQVFVGMYQDNSGLGHAYAFKLVNIGMRLWLSLHFVLSTHADHKLFSLGSPSIQFGTHSLNRLAIAKAWMAIPQTTLWRVIWKGLGVVQFMCALTTVGNIWDFRDFWDTVHIRVARRHVTAISRMGRCPRAVSLLAVSLTQDSQGQDQ